MVWVTFSCDEFCEESDRVAVVVSFYSSADALVDVTVTVNGIGNDSTLYSAVRRQQLLLPVNPTADSISFSIKNGALAADTIVIRYTRHIGFISSECGCAAFAEIQDEPQATKHSIKDIIVTNRKVTTVSYRQGVNNEENIRIYY